MGLWSLLKHQEEINVKHFPSMILFRAGAHLRPEKAAMLGISHMSNIFSLSPPSLHIPLFLE